MPSPLALNVTALLVLLALSAACGGSDDEVPGGCSLGDVPVECDFYPQCPDPEELCAGVCGEAATCCSCEEGEWAASSISCHDCPDAGVGADADEALAPPAR